MFAADVRLLDRAVISGSSSDAGARRCPRRPRDQSFDGAAGSDAVIHTAFNHDFSRYVANCEADRQVIETLGSVLEGSDRLLIVTSGTGMTISKTGAPASEDDVKASSKVVPRAASEEAAASEVSRGR